MQKVHQVPQVARSITFNPIARYNAGDTEKTGPPNLGLAWLLLAAGLTISIGSCNIHIALNL